ncbi:uncharacterized protein Z518_01684 [Rhinocladiella mackenziei CBS 650.93]|uniref:Rhinocladiella mackenziei CBS 650.93 unplaced genomic scaffold supercont1.1, whole genome shotgun sequence n=1 Tax=Rhinocladiella mackenziei CBS 650.93 TaxID=1442369 RepID=A0A0D2JMC9_9EURO|nr:uncharacterized protein Z518_01684 [Rhinocladiella mackenziei CBS 650.93]KIX10600.1 hypothetical protein Z518_01684 [Rhinocladiella mackenziei CBS 650.93]
MAPSSTQNPKKNHNPKARKSATAGPSTLKAKTANRPPAKQVKTKPGTHLLTSTNSKLSKRRQKVYTDKELNLPALNMITPVGVQKAPRGKKKGKIFVDDQESMMTILAMVNAEKEGQIESKMIKARQMEEIREARRREGERKKESKREALEKVKRDLKKGKKKDSNDEEEMGDGIELRNGDAESKKSKMKTKTTKRVSFA